MWSADERESVPSSRGASVLIKFAAAGAVLLLGAVGIVAGLWFSRPAGKVPEGPPPPSRETAYDKDFQLDKNKQKSIWDAEHVTFEIETHVGVPFVEALADQDAARLAAFCREGFDAVVAADETPVVRRHTLVQETSFPALPGSSSSQRLAAGEFCTWLGSLLNEFDDVQRSRLRVLQIERDEADPDLWSVQLLITAHGKNAMSGPMMFSSRHHAVVRFADDEEVRGGRVFESWEVESYSLKTAERSLLDEVTEETGLSELPLYDNWTEEAYLSAQLHVAVEDFNRDGYPDIATAQYTGAPFLLRSVEGRRYENVAGEFGLKPWINDTDRFTCLVGWIDYDNDGYPDLVMGDRLYHNEAGARFTDVTRQSGLRIGIEPMGMTVVDYDCDGWLDIYLLFQQDPARKSASYQPFVGDSSTGTENQLWRNSGNGTFYDVTRRANAGGGLGKTFAAHWFYFDEDHYPDVYIANDFGENVLLRNRGDGTFVDVTSASGSGDYATSMGVTGGDLDNDGWAELYVANMYSKMGRRIIGQVCADDYPEGAFEQIKGSCAGNRLYTRGADGRFVDVSESAGVNEVGWAYAPAASDFDGDGLLDLYATTGFISFERRKPDG